MSARDKAAFVALALVLAGCATPPPPVPQQPEARRQVPDAAPASRAPLIEYPPIEPVAPSEAATRPAPEPHEPATAASVTAPAEPPQVPPTPAAAEPTDEQQLTTLLTDLQRYGTMGPDDLRRELAAATQTLARQRNDYNRVRLAVLYTLAKSSPQDDARAMQLLEGVTKGNPGSPALKQLAAVLHAQVAERQRAVRDEQQKADAAVKKLEALRSMERDLLRDRIRGGGGGGSGGSSGGGGGGGGGGG